MNRTKRVVAVAIAVFSALAVVSACGVQDKSSDSGEKYPTKPIEVVVPYSAGGPTDTLARLIAKATAPSLTGGKMVVVNKPGGSGVVGTTQVHNAPSDGYTLGFIAGGPLGVQPHYGKTSYKSDGFQPIARVVSQPVVLAVKSDSKWKTADDLIAHLEDGSDFKYSSTGAGNPANIAMERFNEAVGVTTKQVPFESGSEALTAMLGGNVDGSAGAASDFKSAVESGQARILLNLGSVKGDFFKDVPTLKDEGFDVATDVTFGLIAPEGLSSARLETLTKAVKDALNDQQTQQQLEGLGVVPNFAGPDEYAAVIAEEYKTNGEVLNALGLIG